MANAQKSIAIIGGGFTGLTAAYELTKKGHKVTLYEAGPSLGGLAAGFALQDGTPLERAYHFLYTTDKHMIGMAEELGIADKLHFYPSSIGAFYGGKMYPFTTAKDLLTFGPLSLVDRLRTGITGLRLLLIRRWQPLTKITAYEWLVRWNGKRGADLIWKPLLVGKFDTYWDKVTMAWLWTRIHVRQTSKKKGEQTERLGYFEGGFQTMVKRWEQELAKAGAEVHLNAKIDQFTEQDGKPALVYQGETRVYDAVLAATASNVFADLGESHPAMEKAYADKLRSIDYLAAATMVFTTKKPISDRYWHQIHDENAPFLVMLSLDALVGAENVNGHHIYYIGDYAQNDSELMQSTDDQIRRKWFDGVKSLFPDFSEDDVEESYVFTFRNSQHIVGVGYEDKIPAMRTPLPGFYLSNFSQIFPDDRGTNYAVRDGKTVAEAIDNDLA